MFVVTLASYLAITAMFQVVTKTTMTCQLTLSSALFGRIPCTGKPKLPQLAAVSPPTVMPQTITDLEYLIGKLLEPTIEATVNMRPPFKFLGGSFMLPACHYVLDGRRAGSRCKFSHLVDPDRASLVVELERHINNGLKLTRKQQFANEASSPGCCTLCETGASASADPNSTAFAGCVSACSETFFIPVQVSLPVHRYTFMIIVPLSPLKVTHIPAVVYMAAPPRVWA